MAFTKLYLTTGTPVYTPATVRGAWDLASGYVTKALSPSKAGGGVLTSIAIAETSTDATYPVLLYRGITGPLAAQTIGGTVNVVLSCKESDAAADDYWYVHIYATTGDTDTPRGTLLADYGENTTNEWSTTQTGLAFQSAQSLAAVALSADDRLVVEIGYVARNSSATSYTGTLYYGTQHPTTYAEADDLTLASTSAVMAGFLSFSASVDEVVVESRTSQVLAEVLNSGTGQVRTSQVLAEVLNSGTGQVRTSQVVVEMLTSLAAAADGPIPTFVDWNKVAVHRAASW